MGILNQFKGAADMMKNMDPQQMREMMAQAKEAQKMLDAQIKKAVEEEIKKRGLVSREEVAEMIRESK
ncbi:MAG: hypothetical protein V1652_01140 [bacterium]